MLTFWKKVADGLRWSCIDHNGKPLGFVQFASRNCWDAYILTGKKWPYGERCIKAGATFWEARRAVEWRLRASATEAPTA